MTKQENEIRKPELLLTKRVYLTEECFKLLKKEKFKQKQSMARIVCDLIIKTFNNNQ